MNPFDIGKPCIKIEKRELLFEQNIMALNMDKHDIEVQDDDVIMHNRIFLYFMQRLFNCLDGLYIHEKCFLVYTVIENQLKRQSVAEIEKLNKEKKTRKKRNINLSLLKKSLFCELKNPNKFINK